MKRKIVSVASLLMLALTTSTFAQKFKVLEGDKKAVKDAKQFNLVFEYNNMMVGKETEADYVAEKKEDYNKKEAGKGDDWEKNWKENRTTKFEPQFVELFNKYGEGMQVGNLSTAPYTMKVATTYTKPGFNIGITKQYALIDGEITVTETAHPEKVILKMSFKGAQGTTFGDYDFDAGTRIKEAYAKLGKELAKELN